MKKIFIKATFPLYKQTNRIYKQLRLKTLKFIVLQPHKTSIFSSPPFFYIKYIASKQPPFISFPIYQTFTNFFFYKLLNKTSSFRKLLQTFFLQTLLNSKDFSTHYFLGFTQPSIGNPVIDRKSVV